MEWWVCNWCSIRVGLTREKHMEQGGMSWTLRLNQYIPPTLDASRRELV
ncbi:hypothetical protein CK203_016563 [Vitis vinifera]|uniref:Uncharacterized protein n=1 Tax=Vitis vinifera TaxID=29760 RepID=A0A438J191_VITVI|nr:hypothetical protein CK203_016563 [Vitis vinifera]